MGCRTTDADTQKARGDRQGKADGHIMKSMVIPSFPHAHRITVAQMKLQILYWLFETHLDVFHLTKHFCFYLIKHAFFWVKRGDEGRY